MPFPQFPSLFPRIASVHASNLNDPQSSNGIVQSVFQALRHPTKALENVVDGFLFASPSQEPTTDETNRSKAKLLHLALQEATTLDQWQNAAEELDKLEGYNTWKRETESSAYNYTLIESRLRELDDARMADDAERMLFLIRTSLTRNLGGMGNIELYKHAHVGTKYLIERYISSTLETLNCLLETTQYQITNALEPRNLLEQVLAARQSFGRSALLLSGGGTFGMNHIGVVKSLWDAKLLPRIVSGASAGSIVCAVLCTKKDDELPTTLEEFCYGDLGVFTKLGEDDGLLHQVTRLLKIGALFDISHLIRVMKNLLGDMTFQEAYNRTRRILNICVSSASVYELPRLLNYVTAPNVMIWSAVAASCSVPVVFTAASILAKDPKTGQPVPWNPSPQLWIDGSVDNDLPMQRLAELFNVNHFIVSQVNPHVTPFIAREEQSVRFVEKSLKTSDQPSSTAFRTLAGLARDEAMHRIHVLSELGVFPNLLTKVASVLNQRYSGDITIFPYVPYSQFPRVLSNPTTDFMLQATLCGEQATWPELSRIRNHCAIELALDDAVQRLRARIAFSPSQIDLRLQTHTSPKRQTKSNTAQAELKTRRRRSRKGVEKVSTSEVQPNLANSSRTLSGSAPLARPLSITLPVQDFSAAFGHTSSRFGLDDEASDNEKAPPSSSPSESPTTPQMTDLPDYFSVGNEEPSSNNLTTWPSTRPLFPHASQPSTPIRPPKFQYPSTAYAVKSGLPVPNKTRSNDLAMTAISQPKDGRPNVASRIAAWQQAADASTGSRINNGNPISPPNGESSDGQPNLTMKTTPVGVGPSDTRRKKRSASLPKSPGPRPSDMS